MTTTIDGTLGIVFPDGSVQDQGSLFAPWQYDWHPYNRTQEGGTETGEVWSFATNGAVALVTLPDFEDGWNYRCYFDRVGTTNAAGTGMRFNAFRETAGAYAGTVSTVGTQNSGEVLFGYMEFEPSPRLVRNEMKCGGRFIRDPVGDGTIIGGSVGSVEAYGAVKHATAQKISRVQFSWATGNFTGTGARITLERKRMTLS